ncbi:hypothetical protein GLAREA_10048 [Glarea lozoyensis ATCC 20868]|uniref:Uncharacterized protein n=1 Tax=Glarea lozoyensis (strain ATCC 20868 / MF5171) TaxID=1116229 RepID=S3DB80_GLAL2|nr:uncharacterized protein GLAREA_10048 [Glarea lozoyensis ATCC 20868]EPE34354.1 hypothetical protein GLAREA_10048 [Glarea lozoyensis ATCC 20868]
MSNLDYHKNKALQRDLRQIISRVAFIPETHIREVSAITTEPYSTLEAYRIGLESFTRIDWNWWPMKPLRRQIKGDRIIKWQCDCNLTNYTRLSVEDPAELSALYVSNTLHSPRDASHIITAASPGTGTSQPPPPSQKSTATSHVPSQNAKRPVSNPLGNLAPTSPQQASLPGLPSNAHVLQMPNSEHVLLAVRRGTDLRLVQIIKTSVLATAYSSLN